MISDVSDHASHHPQQSSFCPMLSMANGGRSYPFNPRPKTARAAEMTDSSIGESSLNRDNSSAHDFISVDTHADTTAFLSDKFEVQDYAKAVLQGRAYRPDDVEESGKGKGATRATDGQGERGDVGVELAKLNQGIVGPHSSFAITVIGD